MTPRPELALERSPRRAGPPLGSRHDAGDLRSVVSAEHAPPLRAAELSDPDGDGLTLTTLLGTAWLTCTTEGEEVTAGPFPVDALKAALALVDDGSSAA